MKHAFILSCLGFCLAAAPLTANAETVRAEMHLVTAQGIGEKIGMVAFTDTPEGLSITADLSRIPTGDHGFHVHQNPDCGPSEKDGKMTAANKAGGHYDPAGTGAHRGPDAGGHKGDLPKLVVDQDGKIIQSMVVKGVKAEDFRNRAVIVHAGGDNYSDKPVELGGGGERIACGVIR